jgi:glycopeptide antibiotics resistance protein
VTLDRLFAWRGLFVLSTLFIVYATTIPWDFVPPPDWDSVQWKPFWDEARQRIPSIPDIVQNVFLFLPFGFFGFFVLRSVILVTILGAMLSGSVELLQSMSPTRTSSMTDLCTNAGGSFLGAAVAWFIARPLETRALPGLQKLVRRQPGALVLMALIVATVFRAWAPFLPTLDIGALKQQVKGFLADPWGPKSLELLLFDAVLYAGLGVVWLRETRFGPLVWLYAGALEFGQFFIQGHSPALQDVAAAWFGIAVGTMFFKRTGSGPAREAGELTRRFPGVCIGFAVALPVLRALAPFDFGEWSAPPANRFVPFASLFGNVTAYTVANFFTIVAVYLPLAYVMLLRRRSVAVTAFACFALATVLEIGQIPLVSRTFDMTEAMIAAASALVAARARQLTMR